MHLASFGRETSHINSVSQKTFNTKLYRVYIFESVHKYFPSQLGG